MQITVSNVTCPICGSEKTRSKVCDSDYVWWYICDNQQGDHSLILDGKEVSLDERFYFTEDHAQLECSYGEFTLKRD